MSKKEKNKHIEKSSFLTSNNFNTSIQKILSSTSKNNFSKNANINRVKLILESHKKYLHKHSRSTYQNNLTSINTQTKLNLENTTHVPTPLNSYFSKTNKSKDNTNLKLENNEPLETKENNNSLNITTKSFTKSQTNNNNINNDISQKIHRHLSPNEKTFYNKKKFLLPEKTSNKKTLVLDLDETLVHSVGGMENGEGGEPQHDFIIQIPQSNNSSHDVHVMVRPHVEEFLQRMSKRFELVIFTASISKYANPLLNIVDKMGYVPFRLFREHCTLINTAFVKDLNLLGRDAKDIIILDNNPTAYSLNHYNGFPIKSWFDDKNDDELLKICPILEFLSYVPDVREYIKKIVVQNKVQFDMVKQIIINFKNSLKKKIIPPECKKIYTLLTDDKNNNYLNGNKNYFDKFMQKSKSTKISIIKSPSSYANKNYNNQKINNFTNIKIINKSNKNNRIFTLEDLNNSINLTKQNPIKIKQLNMRTLKNSLTGKNISKNKDKINYNNKNSFLKKKKIIINTMRYTYPKNKFLTNKHSKNNKANYIINNINNININISNNCSDNNNMTENININNIRTILKDKKIVFKNNNFNKSNKITSPKISNKRNEINLNYINGNFENKNEKNLLKRKNSKNKSKNKVKLINSIESKKIDS
jgi:RNA polymerase II subunit A small phosphatase-like protein